MHRIRTAKTLGNKGGIDCTRGVSREQRAINRRNRLESSLVSSGSDGPKRSSFGPKGFSRAIKQMRKIQAARAALADFDNKECAAEAERYDKIPDQVVSNSAFEEKPFGFTVETSAKDKELSSVVISLALFDGDKMLFACSGIPLPHGTTRLHLTRFVTSARLAKEFNANRYRDDKLRIEVRLPNNRTTSGLLGLYDEDIAIVTSFGLLAVRPVDLDFQATPVYSVLAAGRAFKSGSLMAAHGSLNRERPSTWVSDSQDLTEAVLGGPLIGNGARFVGMNLTLHGDQNVTFLSQNLLRERIEHFQILNPKELHFRGYSLPSGVYRIVPSGFVATVNRIKALGYPMPPPLVLELNGRLLNQFEEMFGDSLAWKGYPFGRLPRGSCERVWARLEKKVVIDTSRRVVSLASFDGDERFFACTGLLIKWHGGRAKLTAVLTSASLVRSRYNEDDIDENLRIEVFLPPNQRGSGRLEWYNLNYNIAIVSVQKSFHAIRPLDIFYKEQKSSGKVVAIGRDPVFGILMASIGEVKVKPRKKDIKLDCKDLQLSTCQIKKAGIGGPLISFDGSFVGMNFYDGSEVTPFLPESTIVEVLWTAIEYPLPLYERNMLDDSGMFGPRPLYVEDGGRTKKRWPVPEPYWYHGGLDVDRFDVPELMGRTLN
ncbi:uncharacterized protein LOC133897142 isoform X2 [Phragmites australis]|uniref:uncharacterized protein LOC133897142 isoform X2 n=1 Tax=Phragmites australis TaxID=29695 RepID=UPI002D769979|nr:uncharacterized protein LOC133897142 isoform X2 [Phragmites australis]